MRLHRLLQQGVHQRVLQLFLRFLPFLLRLALLQVRLLRRHQALFQALLQQHQDPELQPLQLLVHRHQLFNFQILSLQHQLLAQLLM